MTHEICENANKANLFTSSGTNFRTTLDRHQTSKSHQRKGVFFLFFFSQFYVINKQVHIDVYKLALNKFVR